jgi:hypothetical protein
MRVVVVAIEDRLAQTVRVKGSVGEFVAFWMDPTLPEVGETPDPDVEVDLGHRVFAWGDEVVEADPDTRRGIQASSTGYLVTGLATWDGFNGLLSLQLAPNCLTTVTTTGRTDQPYGVVAGLITVRCRDLELWPTRI